MIRDYGFDSSIERRLFSLDASTAEAVASAPLPAGHFACLLVWDARGASVDTISSVVEPLLRAGASYVVCWGPDCERVHDIIDEIASHPNFGAPPDSCIMTTWHPDVPLGEALWFFLSCSTPDEHYADSTRAALAISIGSSAWAREIKGALSKRTFTNSSV